MIPSDQPNVLLEISEQEFRQWQHNPISAAFFSYLDDLIVNWREIGADLLESGAYTSGSHHEDANPDVVRGRILAVRALRGIDLTTIQGFYGKEPAVEVTDRPSSEPEPD